MDSGKEPTDIIQLQQLRFEPYLTPAQIQERVREMGQAISTQLAEGEPVFLIMLKGAFLFAADLIREIGINGEVDFVRTSSYVGTESSREIKLLLPPTPELVKDKDVILIEDIIDSGYTMQAFLPQLRDLAPRSITLVALLHKPDAQRVPVEIHHLGFSIPNKFVVGYGLDYNGLGRQLPGIYQLLEEY